MSAITPEGLKEGTEHWAIAASREAYLEGHRVLADELNDVLKHHGHKLRINSEPLREGDSLSNACEKLRRALPALRTMYPLPADDHRIEPWTLGYVNGKNNHPWNVNVTWIEAADNFIKILKDKSGWSRDEWKECLVDPINKLHSKRLIDFDSISHPKPILPIAAPAAPARWLTNWTDIVSSVGKNSNFKRELIGLNKRFAGPIVTGKVGRRPLVDESTLLQWWNSLESLVRTQAGNDEPRSTPIETYEHGRNETVVPEISGHVIKRRRPA